MNSEVVPSSPKETLARSQVPTRLPPQEDGSVQDDEPPITDLKGVALQVCNMQIIGPACFPGHSQNWQQQQHHHHQVEGYSLPAFCNSSCDAHFEAPSNHGKQICILYVKQAMHA